jgi:hypothetical protein
MTTLDEVGVECLHFLVAIISSLDYRTEQLDLRL